MQSLYISLMNRWAELRNERGATAVEYGLMVGLIAVAIITTVGFLGGALNTLFDTVCDKLPLANDCG